MWRIEHELDWCSGSSLVIGDNNGMAPLSTDTVADFSFLKVLTYLQHFPATLIASHSLQAASFAEHFYASRSAVRMAAVDTSDWTPGTYFFTRITSHNHAGWLYIITLLSLCYIILVFAVRFIVKYDMYGRDDWTLLVSTVVAIGQHIAVLTGLDEGMGKSVTLLSNAQIGEVQKVRL